MLFKAFLIVGLVAYSSQQKVKYQSMRIGDTEVPGLEIQLSEPTPYDWRNDPPAPAKPYISEFKIAAPAKGQDVPEVPQKPQPFSFGFMSMAKDGSQSRQEQQDESGKVSGSYSIQNADGTQRIVEYWADETGFHTNIRSNEQGVETGELGSGGTITKL